MENIGSTHGTQRGRIPEKWIDAITQTCMNQIENFQSIHALCLRVYPRSLVR
jgi:hypothetical protein